MFAPTAAEQQPPKGDGRKARSLVVDTAAMDWPKQSRGLATGPGAQRKAPKSVSWRREFAARGTI